MPVGLVLLGLKHVVVDFDLFELSTIWVVNKVHSVAAGRCVAKNLITTKVFKHKMDVFLCVLRIKA